jgi:hypothetical protein
MSLTRLLLLLFAATLVLACGGDDETIEIDGGKFTVEGEGEGFRILGENEELGEISAEFGKDVKIPDSFPKDIPTYPGASVLAGMVAGGGGMVTLQTGDDPEDVSAFYRENLAKEGWNLTPEMDLGGQRVLAFEKGDRNGAVQVSREGSDTTVVITVGLGG